MVCPQRDGCCGSTGWGKQTGVGMVPVSIWTAAEEKGGPYEKRPFSRAEFDILVFNVGPNLPVSHLQERSIS